MPVHTENPMYETAADTAFHEDLLRSLPDGIIWVQPVRDSSLSIIDFQIHFSNDKANETIRHPMGALTGLWIRRDGMPSMEIGEKSFEIFLQVYQTGQPLRFSYLAPQTGLYVETARSRFRDGVVSIIRERTALRKAEQMAEERAAYANSILESSPNGIYVVEAVRGATGDIEDYIFIRANKRYTELTGVPIEKIMGRRLLEYAPVAKKNGLFDAITAAMQGSSELRQQVFAHHLNKWYEYIVVKQNENHAVVTFQDITEQKNTLAAIRQQKAVLDNILKYSPSGITVSETVRDEEGAITDWRTILANESAERFTGLSKEVMLTKTMAGIDPRLLASDTMEVAKQTLKTGIPFIEHIHVEPTDRWLEIWVAKMDDNHLLNLFTDITATKKIQLQTEQASGRLKAVFNAAQSGMFTFAPERNGEGEVVDFRFVITNKSFAAYVGQTPEVLQGDLGSKWFPGYLTNGVFQMYRHTFITGETQRQDVHYNVDGHDLYLDLMSTKVGDEVLVTFTDYTPLKTAQLQLEKNIEELRRSNTNLEQFAYAASHDMKEPIRKVHFFADRLKQLLADRLDEKEAGLFNRMKVAAERMAALIDDLLEYSHVSRGADLLERIDVTQKVHTVLTDLELAIQEKRAEIHIGTLPTITGHRRQLQQLFQNLISNALKYSKPGVAPQIRIAAFTQKGRETGLHLSPENGDRLYHIITVTDNGIGFEQHEAERIFNVFQRLHGNSEIRGTGVGLSIARKVVENHHGAITAQSEPGKGSVFTIFLPAT